MPVVVVQPPHQATWQSQNQPTLCSCLHYKSSELGQLGTFLVFASWADQALPDHTWNSCCPDCTCLVNVRNVQSGKYGNCTVTAKIPELPNTDCGQDGNLLMPKVNYLVTQQTVVPSEAL